MYSLVTVNQQVSLISVTVTPSTFFVALIIVLIFVGLYVPKLPNLTLPRIPIPRFLTAISSDDKTLPPLPPSPVAPISPISPDRQLVLRDQSLTLFRREKKDSHRDRDRDHDRHRKEPRDRYRDRDYAYRERDHYTNDIDHGRSPRKARRLFAGFRDSSKPDIYDEELIYSPQRTGDGGRSPGGPGRRVRRLLFPSSVAETRQR